MEKIYITSKFIGNESLESRPEEDFGFNFDEHEDYQILGDEPSHKSEAGLVSIDYLMRELETLKVKGANYVGCDWHCDHQELDLYGFHLIASNSDEIQAKIDALKHRQQKNKEQEIANLEEKLKKLKKDLEV